MAVRSPAAGRACAERATRRSSSARVVAGVLLNPAAALLLASSAPRAFAGRSPPRGRPAVHTRSLQRTAAGRSAARIGAPVRANNAASPPLRASVRASSLVCSCEGTGSSRATSDSGSARGGPFPRRKSAGLRRLGSGGGGHCVGDSGSEEGARSASDSPRGTSAPRVGFSAVREKRNEATFVHRIFMSRDAKLCMTIHNFKV